MWIQIRSVDGKQSFRLDNLSKLCKIESLREMLEEKFQVPADRLRLFHGGKQVEDGYTLFDYNVRLNDTIQVLVRPLEALNSSKGLEVEQQSEVSDLGNKEDANKENQPVISSSSAGAAHGKDNLSKYYKVGDLVDAVDGQTGAWFEGRVTKIQKRSLALDSNAGNTVSVEDGMVGTSSGPAIISDDGFDYHIVFEGYDFVGTKKMQLSEFRPRARKKIKFEDIELGSMVMVNHNVDCPDAIGYWYDGMVMKKKKSRTSQELIVRLFIGKDRVPKDNCYIFKMDDIFAIEKHKLLSEQDIKSSESPIANRTLSPQCDSCNDRFNRKCKFCGCHICGGKENPHLQVLCDECDLPYHIGCLQPPLSAIPESVEWYCPFCKTDDTEVVKAGEKLKKSKKKSKMASARSTSTRDWGKGMACVGRSTVCTIVPPNHFGPIPGVAVGSMWKFRVQVSESGVHRPQVGGIHGRTREGAYSIVFSGGYEDDVDHGHEFLYTGSGGRDLTKNKRTAEQSKDQELTCKNRALAVNCAAPINDEKGAQAKNWKKGKPVRVVRNSKARKRSKYAPTAGNRYDGIYKVVRYWPEKGKSGFLVWRYLLRRDDPTPPPWTKEGQERIKELGLVMQYPAGYDASSSPKKKSNDDSSSPKKKSNDDSSSPKKKSKDDSSSPKKKSKDDSSSPKKKFNDNSSSPKKKSNGGSSSPKKKSSDGSSSPEKKSNDDSSKKKRKRASSPDLKVAGSPKKPKKSYTIPAKLLKLINSDRNVKFWSECKESAEEGQKAFLQKVEEHFSCICCQEVVYQPVTTECLHNTCKSCLIRSFKAEVYCCPMCRYDLGKQYKVTVNTTLQEILLKLFPGYNAGR